MTIFLDARTVGRQFSGVGNYVLELVQAFGRLDVDVRFHLCVHGDSQLRDLELDSRFDLCEAAFSPESHPLGDLWEHLILPRKALNLGVDVLHGPAFLIPTRKTRIRKIVSVHDLVAFLHPDTVPRKYAVYMRWLIRRVVHHADRVITGAESVRSDVVQILGLDERRVDKVLYGVSSRFRPPRPEEVSGVRERLDLPNPYLLFVGNLEPRKNLPGLVDAFRRIKDDASQRLDLVVAGKVAWLSEGLLRKLGAEDVRQRIRMTGYVEPSDLPALYGGAEAFVFPTFFEGFGLPVLEAMACGTPVVASNVSSIPEVAGGAAVLVDPSSAESIAEGIRTVLREPERRKSIRQAGLARAAELSWDRTARATLECYRKTLEVSA